MAKKDTRTYSGHWNYYGPEHPGPPPRFPWLRDAIIAGVVGVFVGGSVAYRIVHGFWPYTVTIGAGGFVIHGITIGLGQIPSDLRMSRSDLLVIALVSATTTATSAVATFILAS